MHVERLFQSSATDSEIAMEICASTVDGVTRGTEFASRSNVRSRATQALTSLTGVKARHAEKSRKLSK